MAMVQGQLEVQGGLRWTRDGLPHHSLVGSDASTLSRHCVTAPGPGFSAAL